MAKTSPRQRKTMGRVMHEFKHGELKRSRGGKGGKVKNRQQAIAIALHEAGASKYESKEENKRDFAHTKSKERRGETAQQEREASRMSGRAAAVKAPRRWAARMRRAPRHAGGNRRAGTRRRTRARTVKAPARIEKARAVHPAGSLPAGSQAVNAPADSRYILQWSGAAAVRADPRESCRRRLPRWMASSGA